MVEALCQAIANGDTAWAVAVTLAPEVDSPPLRAALRRLARRQLGDAQVEEGSGGMVAWSRGAVEPAALGRLAARLSALLPEVPGAVRRLSLPADAAALAAFAVPAPAEAEREAPPTSAASLLPTLARLATLPPEAWTRRSAIVALRPGAPARLFAECATPDARILARVNAAGGEAAPLDEAALRLFAEPLLAAAPRLLATLAPPARLVLAASPEAAVGPVFDGLDRTLGPGGLARLIPAMALAEALDAPRAMATARARFAADGQRVLLLCSGAAALWLAASVAAASELIAIGAAAARAAFAGGLDPGAVGPQRLVLTGCASEVDIAFGLAHGISLFEGAEIEARLARRAGAETPGRCC
jgi:hypothetical protein